MEEFVVYLQKKKNEKTIAVEKLAFIAAGLTLLLSAYEGLTRPDIAKSSLDIFFIIISFLTGFLNIIFALVINKIDPEQKKIFFYRLLLGLSGLILMVDGVNKILQNKQSIQYLLIFAGFLYFAVAVLYNDLQKKRFIKITNEGILFSSSLFKKYFYLWNDINEVSFSEDEILLSSVNGKKKINIFTNDESLKEELKLRISEEALKRNIKTI